MSVDQSYGGFLWIVDELERAAILDEYSDMGWLFSDALSGPDWSAKQREIFLVSLDGEHVHFAALVRRRARSAQLTKKFSIEFTHYVRFEPIAIKKIESLLQALQKKYFARASSGVGNRIPPTAWQQVIAGLKNERTNIAAELDKLDQLRIDGPKLRNQQRDITLAQEKDSLGVMLDIFGLPRKSIIPYWDRSSENKDYSFLAGLDKRRMNEDRMIEWDSRIFGNFSQNDLRGYGSFTAGSRELRVWNLNRENLETTIGMDMIYYHEQFNSMVFIQYKRMNKANDEDRWKYYPSSDRHFDKEMLHMISHQQELDKSSYANPLPQKDHRLNRDAFFFKFCEELSFEQTGANLIPGMYVSVNYLTNYFHLSEAIGPRGGKLVSPVRCRYITNTLFIYLIQAGWIGTHTTDASIVEKWIEHGLADQKSLMIGESRVQKAHKRNNRNKLE